MNPDPKPGDLPAWGPPPDAGSVDGVLTAFSQACDIPVGELDARPLRIRGRATIYLVETPTPLRGHSRWVVKMANPDHPQMDIDNPVFADQEFLALTRLHEHFQEMNARSRVPEPLMLFPELGAFAMEHVPGHNLRVLLHYRRSLRQPAPLLNGVLAAGEFLRHMHALEGARPLSVDLRTEAERVLAVATERLRPHGFSLPRQVTRALSRVPSVTVESRQVWLHGDFAPGNVILAEDGSTVGIDPSLTAVGPPEVDLARFVGIMSGGIRFAPGVVAPPVNWIRRRLEGQLLTGYYGTARYPALFELKLIEQMSGRWLRLRELGQRHDPRALLPFRLAAVDKQVRMLMKESSRRLAQGFDQ